MPATPDSTSKRPSKNSSSALEYWIQGTTKRWVALSASRGVGASKDKPCLTARLGYHFRSLLLTVQKRRPATPGTSRASKFLFRRVHDRRCGEDRNIPRRALHLSAMGWQRQYLACRVFHGERIEYHHDKADPRSVVRSLRHPPEFQASNVGNAFRRADRFEQSLRQLRQLLSCAGECTAH